MISLIAAVTISLAPAAPSARIGLDLVFLPEAPDAPSLVLTLDNDGKKRALAYAVLPPASTKDGAATSAFDGTLADDAGTRSPLSTLPQPPRGAGLVERDGALSFTVDDAGPWESAYASLAPSKGAGALPVPGPRGLRVVVHGALDGGPAPAVVYGNAVRIAGTAVVRSSSSPSPSSSSSSHVADVRGVVTSAGVSPAIKPPLFLEASGTVVDRVAACKREAPSAISVVTSSLAMKLYAKGAIACAGPLAIVPVEGVKLDAKKDIAVRGIVIAR